MLDTQAQRALFTEHWTSQQVSLFQWLVFAAWAWCPECHIVHSMRMTETSLLNVQDASSQVRQTCPACNGKRRNQAKPPLARELPRQLRGLQESQWRALRGAIPAPAGLQAAG